MRLCSLLVLLLGCLMPFAARAESLGTRIAELAEHVTVVRPDGAGPFPAIIMLHGCGGQRPFTRDMADVARDAGAAAIMVDSYAHRGITRLAAYASVCTGARLRGRERAGDLFAAVAWARQQSWADGDRLGAIGWSHGGWTILDALALRAGADMERATGLSGLPEEPLQGMQQALIVYPYAGIGSLVGRRPWRLELPSTAIIAEHDYIVGDTRAALERQAARGAPLQLVTFAGVTHAFEDAEAHDFRVRYNAAATEREHTMLREMIAALGTSAPRPPGH